MQHFALELDDRAVSLAMDGRLLTSAPSVVFDDASGQAGQSAWKELRLRPRATSTRHLRAVLTQRGTSARADALVEAELKVRVFGEGQRIWVVAPAQAEAAGLSELLGITRRMGLLVEGFVDGATVTT